MDSPASTPRCMGWSTPPRRSHGRPSRPPAAPPWVTLSRDMVSTAEPRLDANGGIVLLIDCSHPHCPAMTYTPLPTLHLSLRPTPRTNPARNARLANWSCCYLHRLGGGFTEPRKSCPIHVQLPRLHAGRYADNGCSPCNHPVLVNHYRPGPATTLANTTIAQTTRVTTCPQAKHRETY